MGTPEPTPPDDTTAPVTAEGLRGVIAKALCESITPATAGLGPSFNTLQECRDWHDAKADAVLGALSQLFDPADLPARMSAAMQAHYILTNRTTPGGDGMCVCGQWSGGDPGVCEGWDDHLAEVAMSVRWEDAVALAAENTDLRARLHEATGNTIVYHERMVSAQADRDRQRAGMAAATRRAEAAEAVAGEVERLRAERDALKAIVRDLADSDPCEHFDHHGHCQTHGWLDDGRCPHARAAELLAALAAPETPEGITCVSHVMPSETTPDAQEETSRG